MHALDALDARWCLMPGERVERVVCAVAAGVKAVRHPLAHGTIELQRHVVSCCGGATGTASRVTPFRLFSGVASTTPASASFRVHTMIGPSVVVMPSPRFTRTYMAISDLSTAPFRTSGKHRMVPDSVVALNLFTVPHAHQGIANSSTADNGNRLQASPM